MLEIRVYEIKGKCLGYKSGGKLECAERWQFMN